MIGYITGFITGVTTLLIQLALAMVWAFPVNFIWSRIGKVYFDFLPEQWLSIPYWHIVGLIILVEFVGSNIKSLVPKLANVTVNNGAGK